MFSRKMYLEPLKNRTATSILNGFKKIHKQIPELKTVRSDNEFTNQLYENYLKKESIKSVLGTPNLPQSQGIVERSNQTIKRLISKLTLYDEKFDWVKNLDNLASSINSTTSKGTNKTPNEIEALYKNNETEKLNEIYQTQSGIKAKQNRLAKAIVEVGDKVRVFQPSDKYKSRKWSVDVFVVEKIYKPKTEYGNYTYKLKDDDAVYKNEEILKVNGEENKVTVPDRFIISKIIKPTIKNGEPHYEVAWKNYRNQNTEEPRSNLLEDVPKILNRYEKTNGIKFKLVNQKWVITQ
jgi:hypothetical protein